MSFLVPGGLAALALAIPILLLYMLRMRRTEILVSSTFLWQQVLQDNEANSPWQRLKRNVLLFLQLLILLLLVLALARPFVTVPVISAGKIALLLDASASMNAHDMPAGGTRFDAAIAQAQRIIADTSPQDRLAIILVDTVAEPLTSYTNDKNELRRALETAQPSQGPGDWDSALTLAAAGALGSENFRIIILSDGGIGSAGSLPANLPQPIYLPTGQAAGNVAITALATRARPGQPPQLFAQVRNYGALPADISLVIRLDGLLRFSRSASIPPRSQLPIPFPEPINEPFRTLSASITFDKDFADYLALDDQAWLVQSASTSRNVYYVSQTGNLFLEQALRSLPGLQTFRGSPESAHLPATAYDLYVFDGWLPKELPAADMLLVNPPHSTELFTLGATHMPSDNITIAATNSPLVAQLRLDEMALLQYRGLSAAWAQPLLYAPDAAILLAGEVKGQQIAILPFDLRDSNLPLLIAYPVLMANLLDWFSPADTLSLPQRITVGDVLEISPPPAADTLRFTLPDGAQREIPAPGGRIAFTETQQLGLYQLELLQSGELLQAQPFAVNLFAPSESDIAPLAVDELPQRLGGTSPSAEDEQLGLREWWMWLAAAALALLALEWWVYHRRLQVPTLRGGAQRRLSLPRCLRRSPSA